MNPFTRREINVVSPYRVGIVILILFLVSSVFPNTLEAVEKKKMTDTGNRLRFEKSPYLLQHKDNPVDWYPWGDEAFEKAKKENKPIFLSIGYSTCHWCHVMEHESFEDPEVAALMNDTFVSIKVDREERPDIDHIYMTVCQMVTGSGGWPLTIMMTPDKKPFFAATYIPKNSRYGRMGMMELVPRIKDLWDNHPGDLQDSADKITGALIDSALADLGGGSLDESALKTAYAQLLKRFDKVRGGFGRAPKFPTPHNLLFLLRQWKRTGDAAALNMVEKTLQSMRKGGMYDHVGFGFHRYSTDPEWFLPHFEKMMYDQAMLTMAYTEAYLATGNEIYKDTAEEIIAYVLRDMTSPEGGFYSAEDADSEGVEGKFYLWSEDEITHVLGEREAGLFLRVFNTTQGGNYKEEATGHSEGENNILHLKKPLSDIAAEMKIAEKELKSRIESSRRKLFAVREKRVHPHKDDKVLTDWNGLMISALAKAYQAFGEPKYLEAAKKAAGFVLTKLRTEDGKLLHRYRDGESAITAKVEDYAFMIMGLIDLYEASFEVDYLKTAISLNDDFIDHFWDKKAGGFYFTSDYGEKLLIRSKEIYDGAIPSGNSVAMFNLLRLERITADTELGEKASQIGKTFYKSVNRYPAGHTQLMVGIDFGYGPTFEVVIVGDLEKKDTREMIAKLRGQFIPNKVVIHKPSSEQEPEITKIAGFTKSQKRLNGKATAYVCRNYKCNLPTTDVDKMLDQLGAK